MPALAFGENRKTASFKLHVHGMDYTTCNFAYLFSADANGDQMLNFSLARAV